MYIPRYELVLKLTRFSKRQLSDLTGEWRWKHFELVNYITVYTEGYRESTNLICNVIWSGIITGLDCLTITRTTPTAQFGYNNFVK